MAWGKAAKGNHDCDQLIQAVCLVDWPKVDRGRNENDGVVWVIELDAVAVGQADSCVRADGRDGELFEEIFSNLNTYPLLMVCLFYLRTGYNLTLLFFGPGARTTRSRFMTQLLRLVTELRRFIRKPLYRRARHFRRSREEFPRRRQARSYERRLSFQVSRLS